MIMSACETSLAAILTGDELIGLSRGLMYAGTSSILGTLWSISDESTLIFMDTFYRNLAVAVKTEALRRAQLSHLKSKQYAHPFFWAPFVLVGDWR